MEGRQSRQQQRGDECGRSAGALPSQAVRLVSVAVTLAGPVAALPPPSGVDLVPVLTSTPFGAVGGQSVTHTILVSATGTGNATGVRLTFSTTVGLDGVAVSASQGHCSVVDTAAVVCELGVVDFPNADAAPPKVTITGTVKPGIPRGTLVQNLVKVASEPPDADVSNNAATNAYLIPGLGGSPTSRPDVARSSDRAGRRPGYLVPATAAVLALGALASFILFRRRSW
ncbi:hypothetical protein ACQEVZ_60015 [Dactylosporangium sp. CA-152071]|uniref:hypothetical protein n=1 Tax=Dactylosporangium sp. CA-152071 TaxID=3239933 RepID=UPI003D8C37EE